ncbi:hypothetical protein AHF37_10185 [Paragonimus kellicotti]|nr:hypothetical protein AHF37_10185 [Paragonimus kellicotti]
MIEHFCQKSANPYWNSVVLRAFAVRPTREHEAIKSAQKAELILIEVLKFCRSQIEQKEHQPIGDLPISGEEHVVSTEQHDVFANIRSVLLKPGAGFYPALGHLQIRLAMLCGR